MEGVFGRSIAAKVFDWNHQNKGFQRFLKDASFGPNAVRYKGFAHVYSPQSQK